MKQLKSYDEIFNYLFDPSEELHKQGKLSPAQLQIKERCLAIYSWKIAEPLIQDSELAESLSKKFEVTARTLYNDIRAVETLICAIKKANKEYVRFMVTETQKYAIQKEKDLINDEENPKKTTKDLSYAVNVLSKAHNLDEVDPDTPDWDNFQPPDVDVTDDVTVLDIEDTMSDEEAEKAKRKYLPPHDEDIEDADIIGDQ